MLFKQTAEYAVRAVLCMGISSGKALTTHELAEQTRVPAGYLAKVLQTLRRAGLVRSTRGTKGGFVLARPIETMSLYDVLQVIDPLNAVEGYSLGENPQEQAIRRMHHELNELTLHVERHLRAIRLSDLAGASDAGDAATGAA